MRRTVAGFIALVLATSCQKKPVTIALHPDHISLSRQSPTGKLFVEVRTAEGELLSSPAIAWSSSAPDVVTVVDGTLTAHGGGESEITARVDKSTAVSRVSVVWKEPVVDPNWPRSDLYAKAIVAFRDDSERVVFKLAELGHDSVNADMTGDVHNPLAKHAGMTIDLIQDSGWEGLSSLTDAKQNSHWIVDAGGGRRFLAVMEHLGIAEIGCEKSLVGIARVASDQRAEFAKVKEKYYLVEKETPGAAIRANSAVLHGVWWETTRLEAAKERAVRSFLEQLLPTEVPKIQVPEEGDEFDQPRSAWEPRRDRLLKGEGNLSFDLQAFHLAPDGDLRFYVRASWSLGDGPAFAVTAWLRDATPLKAETIEAVPEWGGSKKGFLDRAPVLNVFDRNGDGWGEPMIYGQGYESFFINVGEYTETGPGKRYASYGGGC